MILEKNKKILETYKSRINYYLVSNLKLELHPSKSKIIPLKNGLAFLGYRIFYHHKLLRKLNKVKFDKRFNEKFELYKKGALNYADFTSSLNGWFGYAMWANTYKLRNKIVAQINKLK